MNDRLDEIRAMRAHDRRSDVGYSIREYHRAVDELLAEVERLRRERDEARGALDALALDHAEAKAEVERLRAMLGEPMEVVVLARVAKAAWDAGEGQWPGDRWLDVSGAILAELRRRAGVT